MRAMESPPPRQDITSVIRCISACEGLLYDTLPEAWEDIKAEVQVERSSFRYIHCLGCLPDRDIRCVGEYILKVDDKRSHDNLD